MSASVRAPVVLLVALAVHGAPAGAQDQHPLPGGKDRWTRKTAAQDGVELSVEVERQSFAGGALPIRVTIRNNGKGKLRHVEPGIYQVFTIKVVDQDGAPVRMTRFGQKRLVGKGAGGKTLTLSPGSHYAMVYNLSRLFDLSVSGHYSVNVRKTCYSLDMSQSVKLEVADVGFEVREPNSKDWAAIWKAPKD